MPLLTEPAPGGPNIQTGVNRELDTSFLIHETKPAFVAYTIEMTTVQEDAEVNLCVEALEDPTVVVSSARANSAVLLGLVSIQSTQRQVVMAWVPGGFRVRLRNEGGGTVSIAEQMEITFNE